MQQQQLALTKLKRRKKKNREGEKRTKKEVNKQQETEQMIDLTDRCIGFVYRPTFIY
jgi:hypothetical protein